MKTEVKIAVISNETKQIARLICDDTIPSIDFSLDAGISKTYEGVDFYKCFGKVREDNPSVQFLCKGAKLNVHPSSMSAQMTKGLKAYELTVGKKPSFDDVVYIFDYEDDNLTNNPGAQRQFFLEWMGSKKE